MKIAVVCSVIGLLCGETFAVEPGWYRWADQPARCLCMDGFVATKTGDDTFMIVTAPKGFYDTVGKEFVACQVNCLDCAD
jgi:hypothetical protein